MFRYSNTEASRRAKSAQGRVRLGVEWLRTYAPAGWQCHLFQVSKNPNGTFSATRRFNIARAGECVLSRAFESDPRYASLTGYVTAGSVADYLRKHCSLHIDLIDLIGLGFESDGQVSCGDLNLAWLDAVTSYARPTTGMYSHSPAMPTRRKRSA